MLKALAPTFAQLFAPLRERNARVLIALLGVFAAMVTVYSSLFHFLMEREGRSFSWPTSVYWTLTTMTTLGFGDITFESDAGRIFSIVVLLSGSTFLLVLLPFTFIQFVFVPWMDNRQVRRAPRVAPSHIDHHIVLTNLGPVEDALIERAEQAGVDYVLIVDDLDETVKLHDLGYHVMLGEFDDPETYRKAFVDRSVLVAATRDDRANTNIAFTVREIKADANVVATANASASVDILQLAGAAEVLQLGEVLGAAMADRTLGPDGRSHVIGEFAGLKIAEASVAGTPLVGQTLAQAQLRARLGVGLIGVWDRGNFAIATGGTRLEESSVIILAATPEQLAAYDREYALDVREERPVVIIGGGRVGRAVGRACEEQGLHYCIVEQLADRVRPSGNYVIGDAAERSVLVEAGIEQASAVVITTHDDDVNVYLTLYCRKLRPDIRIVARAKLNRNVSTLYRAGADAVLSYAGTCSAAIWNEFRGNETLMIAEGLNVFRVPVPPELVGKTLAESHIYRRTKCNVVAIEHRGSITGNPDARVPLPEGAQLVVIGTDAAEADFLREFPQRRSRSAWR